MTNEAIGIEIKELCQRKVYIAYVKFLLISYRENCKVYILVLYF